MRRRKKPAVVTGLDLLLDKKLLSVKNKSLALLVNHTSLTSGYCYSWDALQEKGASVVKIFTPEHGLFGTEQDQAPVTAQPVTDIPLVSLYGDDYTSLFPRDEDLEGIDAVIFDIQDVGSRYYTYLNTLIYVMKELHGKNIEVIVLDRPNPLGGVTVEGPLLRKGFESFVGLLPVPVRHGLTAGETALLARDIFSLDVPLTVVAMEGWRREMYFEDTKLPWVLPSPNMPCPETALVYPGMCLFEGTNISEGRGTTTPFELFGAPWINPAALVSSPQMHDLKGFRLRPHFFRPVFNKYGGSLCAGAFIHVTERDRFRPFLFGLRLAAAAHELWEEFRFTDNVYEFNDIHPAFDLLTGGSELRELITSRREITEETWRAENENYLKERKPYLLYP